jgi:predicted site-specific integrase-resolvase
MTKKRYYSTAEIAEKFGVSVTTVNNWARLRGLPHIWVRKVGRKPGRGFVYSDVNKFLKRIEGR